MSNVAECADKCSTSDQMTECLAGCMAPHPVEVQVNKAKQMLAAKFRVAKQAVESNPWIAAVGVVAIIGIVMVAIKK